ncbi:MAG: SigB/SigF/SigG family RNA polymerase sigma factor [Acidimicrobiia bacterium]|nr:SigB/SigF/SigG family RNA polymerase sigma factor [Acidimicrobiia bacterium]
MTTVDPDATDGSPSAPSTNSERTGREGEEALFRRFAETRDRRLRNELVEAHMGLAAHVARRFGRRGPSDDDLRQVAFLALVKAVDRFEPDRNVAFSTFAGRTIEGEIKRHFRDHTWSVRVPRSAKEIHLRLRKATDELTQRNGQSPTVPALATYLGVEVDEVIEGLAAGTAYSTASLDAPAGPDSDGPRQIGGEDIGYSHVADIDAIADLMQRLPEREREIVRLRFYEELSQSEIAKRVGISQMHVSRLLRRSFEQMRRSAGDEA